MFEYVLGGLLKHYDDLLLNEKNCLILLEARNWNKKFFSQIESEINDYKKKEPNDTNMVNKFIMNNGRLKESITSCGTMLDLNSEDYYTIIFKKF